MNLIGHIETVSEVGKSYTLSIYAEVIKYLSKGSPFVQKQYGTKHILTDDGRPCNRLDDNRFLLVATGEILTRVF